MYVNQLKLSALCFFFSFRRGGWGNPFSWSWSDEADAQQTFIPQTILDAIHTPIFVAVFCLCCQQVLFGSLLGTWITEMLTGTKYVWAWNKSKSMILQFQRNSDSSFISFQDGEELSSELPLVVVSIIHGFFNFLPPKSLGFYGPSWQVYFFKWLTNKTTATIYYRSPIGLLCTTSSRFSK